MRKGEVKDVKVNEKSRFFKNRKQLNCLHLITKCAGIYYNMLFYTYTKIYTYVSMSEF